MKKVSIFLSVILIVLLSSCTSIPAGARNLYDRIQNIEISDRGDKEVRVWGELKAYSQGTYAFHLSDFNGTEVRGRIDGQENYGYFYTKRNGIYIGKIIEGRKTQLLETSFTEEESSIIELEEDNTREVFEEKTRYFGLVIPTYGSFKTYLDGDLQYVYTTLGKVASKDEDFIYNTLRLTEEEVSNNKNLEVLMQFEFLEPDRIDFYFIMNDFLPSKKYTYEEYIDLEYHITHLLREKDYYDRNRENLPALSFPEDYTQCEIAYLPGNPINMKLNPNSKTFIKLYLEKGTYSIHFVGFDTGVAEMDLYDENLNLIEYDDYYTISETGIYYYVIESGYSIETSGKLYVDIGKNNDFVQDLVGTVNPIYAGETKSLLLMSFTPVDGFINIQGRLLDYEIYFNEISYTIHSDEWLSIAVEKGEEVRIRIIVLTDQGRGNLIWRFELSERQN